MSFMCDKCKKQLKVFEGDEFEGEYLCLSCLEKTDYFIFKNIKITKEIEKEYTLNFDFQLEKRTERTEEIYMDCKICGEKKRVTEEDLDSQIQKHFNFHKQEREAQKNEIEKEKENQYKNQ